MANFTALTDAAAREVGRRPRDPRDFVRQLDDDYLSCRTEGHRFPKLRRGKAPKGLHIVRFSDGAYQLTYTCPDCGTEKTRTTQPGGGYSDSSRNSYRYPAGYNSPKGAGLRKRDYITENDGRVFETLDRVSVPAPDPAQS